MLGDLPVLVIAASQSKGRGRTGTEWETAPRALAVSLAFRAAGDSRPFSLMAGLAAVTTFPQVQLKWPNDLMAGSAKLGGILVERSDDVVVVGMGVNLWWPDSPAGYGALSAADPGTRAYRQLGARWGAEMMRLIDTPGWNRTRYRQVCQTLEREITWEPNGSGRAIDVAEDGGLVVESGTTISVIYSGAVRHVRTA